jgi:hypothetical protein
MEMKKHRWLLVLFGIIVFILMLCGCATQRRCLQKFPVKDSISYVETVKLDTHYLVSPSDTFLLRVPYDPVSLEDLGIFAKNNAAEVSISVSEGVLQVEAICPEDSLRAVIAQLESREVKVLEIPYPVTEYEVRKIHKYALWFSGIVILLFVLYVANRFKKFLPF